MTGEKNRYSTTEKLWKLDDETLKTPRHDEMVIHLLNVDNIRAKIPIVEEFINDKNTITDQTIKIISEKPITAKNGFLVGYFDIVVSLNTKLKENPIVHGDKCIMGGSYPSKLFIEVKPRVDSFGATLRQLRTYQEYEPIAIGNTYLFTDDTRFKDAFESQGIKYVNFEYEEI